MRPSFDVNEAYMIAVCRRQGGKDSGSVGDIALLFIATGLFIYGVVAERSWCIAAFVLLAMRVIRSIEQHRRWRGVYLSIIEKYEAALEETEAVKRESVSSPNA